MLTTVRYVLGVLSYKVKTQCQYWYQTVSWCGNRWTNIDKGTICYSLCLKLVATFEYICVDYWKQWFYDFDQRF